MVDTIVLLLNDRPMHGYDLIDELDRRTEGAWRLSPGTIYPALRRMEARGLVYGEDDDNGKRVYTLTEDGYQRVADRDPDEPAPWEQMAERGASLRPVVMEVLSQARQIGRFGTADQRRQATEILQRAKTDLYKVMATEPEPTEAEPTEGTPDP